MINVFQILKKGEITFESNQPPSEPSLDPLEFQGLVYVATVQQCQ